jgi:hypothetical protein
MRFFNTAGPVNPADHYCIPPLERFDLDEIMLLLQQRKYFVLHAPRQVGKTSYLLALTEHLNRSGDYRAVYFNVERAQSARGDVEAAMPAILDALASGAEIYAHDPFPGTAWEDLLAKAGPHGALTALLTRWAQQSDKPLVLMIDEIDSLVGDTLIAVLRQLRAGYAQRPAAFPQTVILCGVRDVRDYRIHTGDGKEIITGGSAFNIKAKSLRMGDFDEEEVRRLYAQHTSDTGQVFSPDALEAAWRLTLGQPWLVNALAEEACFEIPAGRDRGASITGALIEEAKENLILRRETHLDQLTDKLREPRVRRVVEPILSVTDEPIQFRPEDIEYVVDLGLIRRAPNGGLTIANPIYQEVIPRELAFGTQMGISQEGVWYVQPDGRLDMEKLLAAFQQFFRENSEAWLERFDYKEAGPQILMQAFLQRIVNGGGFIGREYALGRKRTDLLVRWRIPGGEQRVAIELKVSQGEVERIIAAGLPQTWEYMDKSGAEGGHLVIFDRTPDKPWGEKVFQRVVEYQGAPIRVWGM